MLQLTSISLVQFKNYARYHVDFDQKMIGITGNNGVGKTNLLDAIYYLCFTRSYFNAQDTQNTAYGQNGFRIAGEFLRHGQQETIACVFRQPGDQGSGNKKEITLNDTSYGRFSRHLGYFPAVIVTPDDAVLINGGSEQRRRFLDTLLSQMDTDYLDHLIAYQKILQQRNALLKNSRDGIPDDGVLAALDSQLSLHGNPIYNKRKTFMPELAEKMQLYYRQIAQTGEDSGLQYQSSLHDRSMEQLLKQNRQRDLLLQRTTEGIHRDDLFFSLNDHPVKQSASQGQRKNFLFALKLAQYAMLKASKGLAPLLLLDDIFEKLDLHRIAHLINLISGDDFGQVFITDTEEERLKNAFADKYGRVQLIRL